MAKAINYSSSKISDLLADISAAEQEKTDKRMRLAARIDQAIKAKCWRKINLAKALNKRPSEISKWLSGTHNFNTDTLFDIERILNIELVTLENKPVKQVAYYHALVSENVVPYNRPGDSWVPVAKETISQQSTPQYFYSKENCFSYNSEYQS